MRLRFILTVFICAVVLLVLLAGIHKLFPGMKFTNSTKYISSFLRSESASKKDDPKNLTFEDILRQRLVSLEVPDSTIISHLYLEDTTLELKASVPKGKPLEWIVWYLTSSIEKNGYRVNDCFCESEASGCRIQYTPLHTGLPSVQLVLKRASSYFSHTAKMAILIEDFGFQADQTTMEYLSFPEPLTVSLVASKKLATWTAQIANEYRKEIVLLIPMEPLPSLLTKYKDAMIMVHYPEDKILSILNQSIESIPNCTGFCNLSGERVMSDSRVMGIIFKELKKRHGYFLSSPEINKSAITSLSRRFGISTCEIDVSIDSTKGSTALQDSLRHYAIIAQKTGHILIKSRASGAFISALKAKLPDLKQNGIKLVYVSELIRNSEE
jgi:polysaccharide deacetylase 2 family uncharacterized protein YibQ